MEPETVYRHNRPTQLWKNIGTSGKLDNRLLPLKIDFVLLALVWTNTQRPAKVIEDDGGFRKRPSEIGQLSDLGMVEPGIEAQIPLT